MQPSIYLFFNGQCEEAMSLYADLLDGKLLEITRNGDAPSPEDRMPGGDHLVMNMQMQFGALKVMASDSPEQMYDAPQGFRMQIEATSLDHFNRLHDALAKDALSVDMPAGETFWADRFAMFKDRFGTPWMLNFEGSKAQ